MEALLALADAADAAEVQAGDAAKDVAVDYPGPSPKRLRTQPPRGALVNDAVESLAWLSGFKNRKEVKTEGAKKGRNQKLVDAKELQAEGTKKEGKRKVATGQAEKPKINQRPLLGVASDVGRVVLVPHTLWPTYPCNEQDGRGWLAVVRQVYAQKRCVTVRFLKVIAADEHLRVDVLEPVRGRRGTDSVNDPKPKSELAPETAAASRIAPAAPRAPQRPKWSLTGTSADAGRKVLIPRGVWPDEPCAEEKGRGWRAEIIKMHSRGRAELRFLKSKSLNVCLSVEVLEPILMRAARATTEAVQPQPKPAQSKRKQPDRSRDAVTPSAYSRFMLKEVARLK